MKAGNFDTKNINFKSINKKLFMINIFLLMAFFAVQIIITSRYGTKTQEIDLTRSQKDTVRQENKYLESEIDKAKTYASTKTVIKKYDLVQKTTTFVDDANFDGLAVKVN